MPRIMVDELVDHGKRIGSAGPEWCHLTIEGSEPSDLEALHAFANRIGLKRRWCSDVTQPRSRPIHYDLTKFMRKLALRAGAQFVPALEQAREREAARRLAQ